MPTLTQRYEPAFPIDDLIEHPDNPRHGDEAAIDESMAVHGFYGSVLVQASTRRIIAGNHRTRVARRRGETTVPVLMIDVDDDQARRILLVDNRSNDRATYDEGELARLLADMAATDDGLAGTGWRNDDLTSLLRALDIAENSAPAGEAFNRLRDRFVAPPFTVLDGRAGYWRDRKKRWIDWGLRSKTGREDHLLSPGLESALEIMQIRQSIRGGTSVLKASDAARATASADAFWSGTSIFDPVLAEIIYRWFCPPRGRVCDPFCGGSVRGAVASALGHAYAGYDLRPEQIQANMLQGAELALDPMPDWRVGDARHGVWDGSYDVLMTCPPYWFLERYSDDERDVSTAASVEAFTAGLADCLRPAIAALADDSFAVLVLGAMRDGHRLIDLPGIGMDVMAAEGLVPYNDLVLLTPLASAALRAARNFVTRKATTVHQRVVVAVKGDPLAAAARCGPVEVLDDEAALAGWLESEPIG